MHYVYEITNLINGKKYIGKRSCDCSVEEDRYMGSGKYIKRALKKYGKENFTKTILEVCESEEEAFLKEMHYIKLVEAWKNPMYYNISSGGDGGFGNFAGKSDEELLMWRKKMSESRKGRTITKEWMEKVIKTRKEKGIGCGKNNPMYGVKGKDNVNSKAVVMLSLDGEFIREFDSMQLAKEFIKIKSASAISNACIGTQLTAHGYRWLFKNKYEELLLNNGLDKLNQEFNERRMLDKKIGKPYNSKKNNKKVLQLNAKTLEPIQLFCSCRAASESLGILAKSIRRCCLHGSNTAGGYAFIYEAEFNSISKEDLKELYRHKYKKPSKSSYAKNKKKVICLTTGDIFDGIVDAVDFFNLCKGAKIAAACKGERKTVGKHPETKEVKSAKVNI